MFLIFNIGKSVSHAGPYNLGATKNEIVSKATITHQDENIRKNFGKILFKLSNFSTLLIFNEKSRQKRWFLLKKIQWNSVITNSAVKEHSVITNRF